MLLLNEFDTYSRLVFGGEESDSFRDVPRHVLLDLVPGLEMIDMG